MERDLLGIFTMARKRAISMKAATLKTERFLLFRAAMRFGRSPRAAVWFVRHHFSEFVESD